MAGRMLALWCGAHAVVSRFEPQPSSDCGSRSSHAVGWNMLHQADRPPEQTTVQRAVGAVAAARLLVCRSSFGFKSCRHGRAFLANPRFVSRHISRMCCHNRPASRVGAPAHGVTRSCRDSYKARESKLLFRAAVISFEIQKVTLIDLWRKVQANNVANAKALSAAAEPELQKYLGTVVLPGLAGTAAENATPAELLAMLKWEFEHQQLQHSAPTRPWPKPPATGVRDDSDLNTTLGNRYIQNVWQRYLLGVELKSAALGEGYIMEQFMKYPPFLNRDHPTLREANDRCVPNCVAGTGPESGGIRMFQLRMCEPRNIRTDVSALVCS